MQLEVKIVNFYPIQGEKDDQREYVKGGLHVVVKIGDVELNIRGVLASKRGGKWFFRMPTKTGTDHKTGKSVMYPILSFGMDNDLNKTLLDAIYEKGPVMVEAFLISHPIINVDTLQATDTAASGTPNLMRDCGVPTKQKAYDKPRTFRDPPALKASTRKTATKIR